MDDGTARGPQIRRFIKYGSIIVALIIIYAIQPFSYENIDAGNVGIKINYGSDRGVDNITIVTGRVWYNTNNGYKSGMESCLQPRQAEIRVLCYL